MGWAARASGSGSRLVAIALKCRGRNRRNCQEAPCAESRVETPDRRVERRRPRFAILTGFPRLFICARAGIEAAGVQISIRLPQFGHGGRGARTWYGPSIRARALHFSPSSRMVARAGYRRILLGTLVGNVAVKKIARGVCGILRIGFRQSHRGTSAGTRRRNRAPHATSRQSCI